MALRVVLFSVSWEAAEFSRSLAVICVHATPLPRGDDEVASLNAYIKLIPCGQRAVTRRLTPHHRRERAHAEPVWRSRSASPRRPDVPAQVPTGSFSAAATSSVVNNLSKQGLVVRLRTGSDKRYSSVHLAARNSDDQELFPSISKRWSKVFYGAAAGELKTMSKLCRRVGRASELALASILETVRRQQMRSALTREQRCRSEQREHPLSRATDRPPSAFWAWPGPGEQVVFHPSARSCSGAAETCSVKSLCSMGERTNTAIALRRCRSLCLFARSRKAVMIHRQP